MKLCGTADEPMQSVRGEGEARVGAVPDQTKRVERRRFPIAALIALAVLAFAVSSIVEPLNLVSVLGFPLGFFLVAQGSLIAFLLIAVGYARRHDRLTRDEPGDA